ncbi:hypothetical protein F4780DRAFT_78413 [Xylariomycetidae sp. FL0641]|nr:hypothetical protein F4780DRAFT_78413 [Xylariomycetidae sp. FL0641]
MPSLSHRNSEGEPGRAAQIDLGPPPAYGDPEPPAYGNLVLPLEQLRTDPEFVAERLDDARFLVHYITDLAIPLNASPEEAAEAAADEAHKKAKASWDWAASCCRYSTAERQAWYDYWANNDATAAYAAADMMIAAAPRETRVRLWGRYRYPHGPMIPVRAADFPASTESRNTTTSRNTKTSGSTKRRMARQNRHCRRPVLTPLEAICLPASIGGQG